MTVITFEQIQQFETVPVIPTRLSTEHSVWGAFCQTYPTESPADVEVKAGKSSHNLLTRLVRG